MIARRPATAADIPFLLALRQATMDVYLRANGIQTDDDFHLARVRHRFDCAQLLLHSDKPAGLLKVDRSGPDWELIQFQLAPQWQGKGMGRQVLDALIAEADGAGAGLTLGVLMGNPARQLYERAGFHVIAELGDEYRMRRAVGSALEIADNPPLDG
jgi:GNAT superfamily N-acetyltransferase